MANVRLTDKTALDNHTGTGDLYMIVDVSDTTGSAAGTSKKLDSKFVIMTDKISVSNAELQAMDATGGAGNFKTLISAPGVGYMIIPLQITILCTYASSTESSAKTMYVGYEKDQTVRAWTNFSRIMNAVATSNTFQGRGAVSTGTGVLDGTINNAPLYLWSNGNFNGGWSCDVYITYNIVLIS
jgi:hypothetical protein